MNTDRTKNFGHQEMSNGPSFNWRTPWTIDPTDDDYAMADAREEAWIKAEISKHGYPFTYDTVRSYVSRNVLALSGSDATTALTVARDPDATLYRLFEVARLIHATVSEDR